MIKIRLIDQTEWAAVEDKLGVMVEILFFGIFLWGREMTGRLEWSLFSGHSSWENAAVDYIWTDLITQSCVFIYLFSMYYYYYYCKVYYFSFSYR